LKKKQKFIIASRILIGRIFQIPTAIICISEFTSGATFRSGNEISLETFVGVAGWYFHIFSRTHKTLSSDVLKG
jgi:hypothetical protein